MTQIAAPWTASVRRAMHVRVPAAASVLLAVVLATAGRAFVGSRLDVRCRDGLGRGTYDCTTLHGWLTAGSAGQVLLAAAATGLLGVSARSAGQGRRVTAAAWVLIPLSLGWIAVTSVLGYQSF